MKASDYINSQLGEQEVVELPPLSPGDLAGISAKDYIESQLSVKEEEEKPGFIESAARVGGAIAGGLLAFPYAGAGGIWEILKTRAEQSKDLSVEDILSAEFEGKKVFTPKQTDEMLHRATQKIERIAAWPAEKLLKTEGQLKAVETITKPLEWISYAGEFYGDYAIKHGASPELAAGIKSGFEIAAFFGLPKLFGKLRANVKAGKLEAVRETIKEIHRERLNKLKEEPNRLKHLAEAEKKIGNEKWVEDNLKFTKEPYKEPIIIEPEKSVPIFKEREIIEPDYETQLKKATKKVGGKYGIKETIPKEEKPYAEGLREHERRVLRAEEKGVEAEKPAPSVEQKRAPEITEKREGESREDLELEAQIKSGDEEALIHKTLPHNIQKATKKQLQRTESLLKVLAERYRENDMPKDAKKVDEAIKTVQKAIEQKPIEKFNRQDNIDRFIISRNKSTRPEFLTPYTKEELNKFEVYQKGDVGYAITPEKDLVNVFNNSTSKGAGKEAIFDSITKGAETLDCFDGFLPKYYGKFGFEAYKFEKWNDAYKPENWDLTKYGKPDIIYMRYQGVTREPNQLRKSYGTFREYRHPGFPQRDRAISPMDKGIGERTRGSMGEREQQITPESMEPGIEPRSLKPQVSLSLIPKSKIKPTKPKALGRVWDGNKFRPFVDATEITRGKKKGQYWITFGDGKKKRFDLKDIKFFEKAKESVKEVEPEVGKKPSDLTISMLGTQGIYEAIVKKSPQLKTVAKSVVEKAGNILDVEKRFKKIGAENTGYRAMGFFSRWDAEIEKGIDLSEQLAKLGKYKKERFGYETVIAAESKRGIKQLKDPIQKQIAEKLLKLHEDSTAEFNSRGVKVNFEERIVSEIEKLIETADESEIPQLEKALKAARDIKWIHIPTNLWFESKFNSPTSPRNILKLLAAQKRKTFTIKSLVDEGKIKPEDINVFDIIASLSERRGRDLALLDIRDAAIKDKIMVKPGRDAPANFVKPPRTAPILKGYKIHPILADYIKEITGRGLDLGKIQKYLSITKMWAFINPAILPMYDVMQHSVVATANKWSLKYPKSNVPFYYTARGIKHYLKRTPEYYEALENYLSSKPYNNPFSNTQALTKWKTKSIGQKIISALETAYPKNWIKNPYNASWHIAWEADKAIRMGTYLLLKDKGFSPKEAGLMASRAHGAYATVPPTTRRVANIPFFTPTFKIIMLKFYGDMLKSPMKIGKEFVNPDAKLSNTQMTIFKSLMGAIAVNEAYDLFMHMQGFKRDQWGRRYYREIETEEGLKKEHVITWTHPFNILQKWYSRAANSFAPEVEKPIAKLISQNRYEFHPFWRHSYEVITNQNAQGNKIYDIVDDLPIKARKSGRYLARNVIALIGKFDPEEFNQEGREILARDFNKAFSTAINVLAFSYTRSVEDRRRFAKIKRFQKEVRKELFRKVLNDKEIDEKYWKSYQEKFDKLLEE